MNCPHCGTEISEHPANRCLDAWVAESVMDAEIEWIEGGEPYGWDEDGKAVLFREGYWINKADNTMYLHITDGFTGMIPYHSKYIAAAWEVLEKFSKWAIYAGGYVMLGDRNDGKEWKAHALKIPHAICRAALLAVRQG